MKSAACRDGGHCAPAGRAIFLGFARRDKHVESSTRTRPTKKTRKRGASKTSDFVAQEICTSERLYRDKIARPYSSVVQENRSSRAQAVVIPNGVGENIEREEKAGKRAQRADTRVSCISPRNPAANLVEPRYVRGKSHSGDNKSSGRG